MGKPPVQKARTQADDAQEILPVEVLIEQALEGKVLKRELGAVTEKLTQIVISEQFSGPLPHPRHFREYEQIAPGSANRMIAMAERNLEYNIASHEKAQKADIEDTRLGVLLGAGLFALLITGAFGSLFVTDNPVIPGIFLGAAALGAIPVFVNGRKR